MDLASDVTELQHYLKPSFKWKFFILLLLVNVCSKAALGADSSPQQSLPSFSISITYHNKFLAGYVMKRLHLNDWLQCVSACSSAEDCISYNFYPNLGTCELKSEGITELARNCPKENSLVFSQGSIFQQIRGKSYWSPWQSWGPCSATCDKGVKRRMRVCIASNDGGCSGPEMEERECSQVNCPDSSQFCVGRADGNYPDESDCHRFIQCSGDRTFIVNCQPAELMYDSDKNQCVRSSDSDCGNR